MSDDAGDCPTCGAAGSVLRGYCQVCYAEVEKSGAADLPPAAPGPSDLRLLGSRSVSRTGR
jgi:hypothetical protein